MIISNPPYVSTGDFATIQPEVADEPRIALDGGADGLDFYRTIVTEAPKFLSDDGFLAVEIGADQAEAVTELMLAGKVFKYIQVWKDLGNIERVVAAWKK